MEVFIVLSSNKICFMPCITVFICVYNDNIMRIWVDKCTNRVDLLYRRLNKKKINRKNCIVYRDAYSDQL